MTVAKSSKKKAPRKPYPGFPLRALSNGQWGKKIRGVVRCCGTWDKPAEALAKYKANRVYWETGTTPKDLEPEGVTVRKVLNEFLDRLKEKADAGDRTKRHFDDCYRTGEIIVATIDRHRLVGDLTGSDFFELRKQFEKRKDGKKASPATVLGHIRRTVAIFQFAVKEGLVDRVVYGADFRGLSEKQKTRLEASAGDKLLDAVTIRKLLNAANYRMRAMILLGINCGCGNADIGNLSFDDVDLVEGWYETDRSKTGVRRCAKLWPETIQALETVYAKRFEPGPGAESLVFVTRHKRPFTDQASISNRFRALVRKCKLKLPAGAGFYSLRHTCRTVADQSADETAKRWIVGHKRSRIEDRYIHAPPRERIAVICESVRQWLLAGKRGAM